MQIKRNHRPITRAAAGTCVGWMVASAGLTILFTRLFLVLTGFPQVGGGTFHIAHAVWGGLLLMVALSIALALANRWAAIAASLVGGIGAGFFVDEIGKFITADNDYFFPLAAPLAYGVLVVFAFVAFRAGSRTRDTARGHLYAALDLIKPTLDGPMTQRQIDEINGHLERANKHNATDQTRALAEGLRQAVAVAQEDVVPEESTRSGRLRLRLHHLEQRLVPLHRARRLSRIGLGIVAVIGLIGGPGVFVYSLWQIFGPGDLPGQSVLGQHPGPVAWTAAAIAAAVALIAGVLATRAIRGLGREEDIEQGARWGIASMALLLGGVNVLTSYFSQFVVLVDALIQASVLAMLLRLERRTH